MEKELLSQILFLLVHERAGEGEEALLSSYQYDALGQLVREDSTLQERTIVYSYDSGGNLTEMKEYAYTAAEDLTGFTAEDTVSYGYDGNWKDKLTVLDGETITCDEMGNPLSYRGKTLAWEGRRLESLAEEELSVSYTYDSEGMRTGKRVNGVISRYYYSGGQLSYEQRGMDEFFYLYDSNGNLAAIRHYDVTGEPETYHAGVNSRGDVEFLYTDEGSIAARYRYDAWGNIAAITDSQGNEITDSSHIGQLNPIRYRGYYYDAEVGLYNPKK